MLCTGGRLFFFGGEFIKLSWGIKSSLQIGAWALACHMLLRAKHTHTYLENWLQIGSDNLLKFVIAFDIGKYANIDGNDWENYAGQRYSGELVHKFDTDKNNATWKQIPRK